MLADGDKLVKLQRYDPADPRVDFDLEEDSPELEAELLKSIGGPYTPYARQDLEAVAERVRREMEKK